MLAGSTSEALSSKTLPMFSQSMVMAAGSWNLTHCHLNGPFNFHLTVTLLPTTIESLMLQPEAAALDDMQSLNNFARFTRLSYLKINLGAPLNSYTATETCEFYLTDPIPSLKSLSITPFPLSLPYVNAGDSPSTVLPGLEELNMHAEYQLAKVILQMPRLKLLSLVIFVVQVRLPIKQTIFWTVPLGMQKLHLNGPRHPDVYITVQIPETHKRMSIVCLDIEKVVWL